MQDINVIVNPNTPIINVTVSPTAVAGAGQSDTLPFVAGESISGGNAVYLQNNLLYRFNSNNVNLQGKFLGIAKTAGSSGGIIDVFVSGIATIPTWGLTADASYFATLNGAIATSPSGVLNEMVGVAIASDKLLIKNTSIKTV